MKLCGAGGKYGFAKLLLGLKAGALALNELTGAGGFAVGCHVFASVFMLGLNDLFGLNAAAPVFMLFLVKFNSDEKWTGLKILNAPKLFTYF